MDRLAGALFLLDGRLASGTHALTEDPWDDVQSTTWNLLPFLLQRTGEAPAWVVNLAFTVRSTGLVALAWVAMRLRNTLSSLRTASPE